MRGRKPNRRSSALVRQLESFLALQQWTQARLASELGVSPSTVTRALASKKLSPMLKSRAEALLRTRSKEAEHDTPRRKSPTKKDAQELHLLRSTYTLLVELDSKVETLLAGTAGRRG